MEEKEYRKELIKVLNRIATAMEYEIIMKYYNKIIRNNNKSNYDLLEQFKDLFKENLFNSLNEYNKKYED